MIEDNNLEIQSLKCYDPQSAWHGEELWIVDKKKFYNLFEDYPHNMTLEEVEIFDKENPFWADFFSDRK